MKHERGTLGCFQELFELAPAVYVVTDGHLVIDDANHAAARLLRRPRDELVGKPLLKFVERLVSRTSAPGDTRRLSISLTSAGRALLRRAPDTAQARLIHGLRSLERSELRGLADYLSTLDEILLESASEGRSRHGGSSRLRRQA